MTPRVSVINIANFVYRGGMRGADLNSAVKLSAKLMDSPIRLFSAFFQNATLIPRTVLGLNGTNAKIYDHVFLVLDCPSFFVCLCVCVMTVLRIQT